MDKRTERPSPPLRPEREVTPETTGKIGDAARALTIFERLANMTLARRLLVLIALAAAWEIYARILDNPLLFPSLTDTLTAFWQATAHGVLSLQHLIRTTGLRNLGQIHGMLARRAGDAR